VSTTDEAHAEEPLRIWWNRNLGHKISPSKLAAHAAHAALKAYGIEYTHPIVVLAAGKSKIEAMPITIHDAGRTELAPGTLTTGVERSWQASRKVEITGENEELIAETKRIIFTKMRGVDSLAEQLAAAQAVIAEVERVVAPQWRDSTVYDRNALIDDIRAILPQSSTDALEAVKHRVWREGFDAGERDVMQHEESTFDTPCVPSPYRAAATSSGEVENA